MTTTIAGFLRVTGVVEPVPEGGFVSRCPEFAIASEGDSIDEALFNIREALDVYLETLVELGDLDKVLAQRSLKVFDTPPESAVSLDVTPGQIVATIVAAVPQTSAGK
jgi:predicted RNase H-like HicB family nuclease